MPKQQNRREMRFVPEGHEVRRKLGRDEEEGVVRLQVTLTLEEWARVEEEAAERGKGPSAWIMWLIRKKIGSSFS